MSDLKLGTCDFSNIAHEKGWGQQHSACTNWHRVDLPEKPTPAEPSVAFTPEMLERLQAMVTDHGEHWDLNETDEEAIGAALSVMAEMYEALQAILIDDDEVELLSDETVARVRAALQKAGK